MPICPYCRGALRWNNLDIDEDDEGEREMYGCPHCGKVVGFG